MPSLVELKYNPFFQRLSILIDGNEPSQYSGLVQYTNEPISVWKSQILPAIYEEIRDDFYVSFTGVDSDAQIIRYHCQEFSHCLGIQEKKVLVEYPVRDRLIGINREIRNQKIAQFGRTVIDAVLYITPSLQHLLPDLLGIQISNLFCTVRFSADNYAVDTLKDTYSFLVGNTEKECASIRSSVIGSKAVYELILDKEKSDIQYFGDHFLCSATNIDELKNAIFLCLLGQPFQEAIFNCYSGLSDFDSSKPEMLKNFLIEPVVSITLNESVEVGRSNDLIVTVIPNGYPCPKLNYRVNNQEIASCDGFRVHALTAGNTIVEAYYSGEKMPFWKQPISTYERNRIKNIFLSENQLLMGCGDSASLKCSYSPKDADNTKEIRWQSSDESILKVSQEGVIHALKAGRSKIICSAENVSAICNCTVKPYLQEIHCGIVEQNGGVLQMSPGQELKMDISIEPTDCFDKELSIISSNYDIVNIANGTLIAKNTGDATVAITNNTRRKQYSFQVSVRKHIVKEKKKGLLSFLFGE